MCGLWAPQELAEKYEILVDLLGFLQGLLKNNIAMKS